MLRGAVRRSRNGMEHSLRTWNLKAATPIRAWDCNKKWGISCLAVSRDARWALACNGNDIDISLSEVATGRVRRVRLLKGTHRLRFRRGCIPGLPYVRIHFRGPRLWDLGPGIGLDRMQVLSPKPEASFRAGKAVAVLQRSKARGQGPRKARAGRPRYQTRRC